MSVAVPLPALRQHPPGGDVQSGEQRRRAVPDIVVGVALDVAQAHRQRRLRAIERLNLRLFIHAQHHRVVRRVEVQPDDVAHFLDEERIGGQLEGLRQVRLDPEQGAPALHRALANALGPPQGAGAPVRGGVGRLLQRAVDHRRHLVVVIGPRPTGPEFVVQPLDAGLSEASAPLADGVRGDADAPRDGSVGQAFGAGEDHAGSLDQGVGHGGRVSDPVELIPLLVGEREQRQFGSAWHGSLLCMKPAKYAMNLRDATLVTWTASRKPRIRRSARGTPNPCVRLGVSTCLGPQPARRPPTVRFTKSLPISGASKRPSQPTSSVNSPSPAKQCSIRFVAQVSFHLRPHSWAVE